MVCLEQPFIGLSFFTIGSETKYTNQQNRGGRVGLTAGGFSVLTKSSSLLGKMRRRLTGWVVGGEVRGGV